MNVEDITSNHGDRIAELQKKYMETFTQVEEGQMLPGKVVEIGEDFIYVDVGLKSEGKIPVQEFEKKPEIGNTIYVILLSKESKRGEVIVSKQKADEKRNWKNLRQSFDQHTAIQGTIARKIKGGYDVDLGDEIRAFLPLSKADIARVRDPETLVGKKSSFYIERLYHHQKVNIVVTRREWLQDENKKKRAEFFTKVKIGDVLAGRVKSFTSFGAFIDLGGFDGLLHINDMSWGHINSPKDLIRLDDDIEVKLIRLDPEENKINLSLKHFTEDPWTHFESRYQTGDVVKGRVTKLAEFGAFIELEEGIEGLAHISEMSWVKKIRHPREILTDGDLVETKILSYDIQQGKLSLGLKQVLPNPWDEIDQHYPVGMRITRKVKNITNFGAFIELEEGIDGLLHLDDMSWTKKIKHPTAIVQEGQEIEVMVIDIGKEARRIKLGIKQLTEDPWDSLVKAFPRGSVIAGQVTNITEFGFFVKVQGDIEGLVSKGNIFDPNTENMEEDTEKYKIGDSIKAVVLDIQPLRQRLALSIKEYDRKTQAEDMIKYIHDDSSSEKATLAELIQDKTKK